MDTLPICPRAIVKTLNRATINRLSSKLCDFEEAENLVKSGRQLILAGDESVLQKLPKGNWIGGSIPYFMGPDGGLVSKEKVFVTELPNDVRSVTIALYDENEIENIYVDTPENGFTILILPATTLVHLSFALHAPDYRNFASRPVIGWISGVHLNDLGKISPKVFDGRTAEANEEKAIVMRVALNADYSCQIGVANIFSQGSGDTIEFLETSFSARTALINGKRTNLADYIVEKEIGIRLPLVGKHNGTDVNVSFQEVDSANHVVNFYAPVFKGVQYKVARDIPDYLTAFSQSVPKNVENVLFSCNCILNFLYSKLEGKKTGTLTGPTTFGEVAYRLLNQTLVYLAIEKKN